jgi:hypothetical protein
VSGAVVQGSRALSGLSTGATLVSATGNIANGNYGGAAWDFANLASGPLFGQTAGSLFEAASLLRTAANLPGVPGIGVGQRPTAGMGLGSPIMGLSPLGPRMLPGPLVPLVPTAEQIQLRLNMTSGRSSQPASYSFSGSGITTVARLAGNITITQGHMVKISSAPAQQPASAPVVGDTLGYYAAKAKCGNRIGCRLDLSRSPSPSECIQFDIIGCRLNYTARGWNQDYLRLVRPPNFSLTNIRAAVYWGRLWLPGCVVGWRRTCVGER